MKNYAWKSSMALAVIHLVMYCITDNETNFISFNVFIAACIVISSSKPHEPSE